MYSGIHPIIERPMWWPECVKWYVLNVKTTPAIIDEYKFRLKWFASKYDELLSDYKDSIIIRPNNKHFSNLDITIKYGILSLIEYFTCSHNEIGRYLYEKQGHLLCRLLEWTWQHRALDKNVNGYDVWENA